MADEIVTATPVVDAATEQVQVSEGEKIQETIDKQFSQEVQATPQPETKEQTVEVPVDIAQKGIDYTQKTQQLALEKADVEASRHNIQMILEGLFVEPQPEQPIVEQPNPVEQPKTDTVAVPEPNKPPTDDEKLSKLLDEKLKPIFESVERDKLERQKQEEVFKQQQYKAQIDAMNTEINGLAKEYPYFDKAVSELFTMSQDKTVPQAQKQVALDKNLAFQAMNLQSTLGYQINPKTMKPYTLKESYEFVAFQNGVGLEKPDPKEIAKNASLQVPVSTGGNVPPEEPKTMEEAIAAIGDRFAKY